MTARKYFTVMSTVIIAVLFVFIFAEPLAVDRLPASDEPDTVSVFAEIPDSPAGEEMLRLLNSEIEVEKARNAMNLREYLAADDTADFASAEIGVELEVICETETVLSFAIRRTSDGASPYGRVSYYNLDPHTGVHLDLEDVLGTEYRETVMDAVEARLVEDGVLRASLYGIGIAPLIGTDRMFYVTDGGVTVVFDVGEIADESYGMVEIRVNGSKKG